MSSLNEYPLSYFPQGGKVLIYPFPRGGRMGRGSKNIKYDVLDIMNTKKILYYSVFGLGAVFFFFFFFATVLTGSSLSESDATTSGSSLTRRFRL